MQSYLVCSGIGAYVHVCGEKNPCLPPDTPTLGEAKNRPLKGLLFPQCHCCWKVRSSPSQKRPQGWDNQKCSQILPAVPGSQARSWWRNPASKAGWGGRSKGGGRGSLMGGRQINRKTSWAEGGPLLNSAGPAFCDHNRAAAHRPPGHRDDPPSLLERPVGARGCVAPGHSRLPAPRRWGICVLVSVLGPEVCCGEDTP